MATQEDLDRQNSINLSIQERLALLEREKSTLLEEADIYKRLLGTNLDLSQVRSRYQSDEKDILQTIRTNTNILKDQSKQITFQVAEKSRIQKISNDILNISENSYSVLMEELGTSRNIGDIEKKREILAKRLIELESFRGTILFEDKELQAAFNEELENSIKGASDLEAQLTEVQNTSEKIQGNVSWFEALKETSNKIGLGKFTDAFTAAEEAARETAVANELSKKVANELVAAKEEEASAINKITEAEKELQAIKAQEKEDKNKQRELSAAFQKEIEGRKGIAQLTQKELETGEGLTAERLKQLNLSEITGNATGTAAKELIKQFKTQSQSRLESLRQAKLEEGEAKKATAERKKGLKDVLNQAKQEKTLSGNRIKGLKGQQQQLAKMTGKAGMKGLQAGAKALGPLLKKALGPISIILMVKDVFDFIKDAVFAASKRTAELQRNLGISREEAKGLNDRIYETAAGARDFADTIGETSSKMGGLAESTNRVQFTSKQIAQSFNDLNKSLGTNLDFTQALGEEGQGLLVSTAILRDNFGLSEKAIAGVTNEALRTNQAQDDIVKGVLGEIRLRNLANKTAIDEQQVLEDIFNLSAKTRAMFGLQTKELAIAVYEARKLGFNLEDLNGTADSLLDFEGSIAKELEAELLLGKDLNLEKARQLALNNDLVGVAEEIRNQNVDIVALSKENRIAAQAYADAVGMPLETLVKQEESLRATEAIQKRLNTASGKYASLRDEEGKLILSAQDLQTKSLKELQSVARQAGLDEAALANLMGDRIYSAKLAEDAQTKFNKALEVAKDQFSNFVGSGMLQDLIDMLADFAAGFSESYMFEFFAGDEAERATRKVERELNQKATHLQEENEALAATITQLEERKNTYGLEEDEKAQLAEAKNQKNLNEKELGEVDVNKGKITNIAESSNSSIVGRETAAGAASGAIIGAGIGTVVPVIGTAIGAAVGGIIGGIGGYLSGTSIDEAKDAETLATLENATQEDGSINFTKIETNDAIIRPNQKQIVVPDEQDVIATFKPQGIIDKTLSAAEGLTQPLTTVMSPIVGAVSSFFNSFTPEPNPTPEPPKVDITELAKTNIVAAESYAEAMGMSLDALINKPTPSPEPTTVTDNSELVKEITQLRKDLNQLNNRPVQVQSTINMDGNQVATALGMGGYALGNQI